MFGEKIKNSVLLSHHSVYILFWFFFFLRLEIMCIFSYEVHVQEELPILVWFDVLTMDIH